MLEPMTHVRIVGRSTRLEGVMRHLYRLRLLQLEPALPNGRSALTTVPGRARREARTGELRALLTTLDGLLEIVAAAEAGDEDFDGEPADVAAELDRIGPEVERLAARIEELRTELAVLPRYLEPLRRLLPLVPELASLDEHELRGLQLDTVALVLNTDDDGLVEHLRDALRDLVGDRFELVATRVAADVVACLVVVSHRDADAVRDVFGREQVRHLPLPQRYERLSFNAAVAAMERRLDDLPRQLERAEVDLRRLLAPRAAGWIVARRRLAAELDQLEAVDRLGATAETFVAVGWTPAATVPLLRDELERAAAGEIAVDVLEPSSHASPPVLMRNPAPARPFEFLVRLLDLPRAGSLDPTLLMAFFLPVVKVGGYIRRLLPG